MDLFRCDKFLDYRRFGAILIENPAMRTATDGKLLANAYGALKMRMMASGKSAVHRATVMDIP